ncbi:hypothetical protein [Enterobacter bugandensis]|uniref:hypothetical protein n=1 Tax=Enterobacter bugandensis TaxID=881260 RepID=UPI0032AE9F42
MKINIIIPAFLVIFSMNANANANDLVFKCTTNNNKQVSLYRDGENIKYIFGKKNSKPELEIIRKKSDVKIDLEDPEGGGLSNSVEVKNGAYSYQLISNIDKFSEEHESTTSLNIMKGENVIKTLYCTPNSVYGDLINIDPTYFGSRSQK